MATEPGQHRGRDELSHLGRKHRSQVHHQSGGAGEWLTLPRTGSSTFTTTGWGTAQLASTVSFSALTTTSTRPRAGDVSRTAERSRYEPNADDDRDEGLRPVGAEDQGANGDRSQGDQGAMVGPAGRDGGRPHPASRSSPSQGRRQRQERPMGQTETRPEPHLPQPRGARDCRWAGDRHDQSSEIRHTPTPRPGDA